MLSVKNFFEANIRQHKFLGLDADVLLAMAGKVSSELQEVVRNRPELFGALLRELKSAPDHAVLRLVREVHDGEW